MHDNLTELFKGHGRPGPATHRAQTEPDEEETCAAFGFLRGIRDQALAIEFRRRDGNSEWLSYNCLVSFRFNPSQGILLRFSADVVTLVLIRGSNLDVLVGDQPINLTDRGLQRHRITFVREMDEAELKRAGSHQPTIDRIEIAEFESHEEAREYLKKTAHAFLRE
jgi:hypothetical protein